MSEIKLCKDCKHFVKKPAPIASRCRFEVEPVYGGPAYDAYVFRMLGQCGREGVFFEQEQKPKAVAAPAEKKAHIEFNLPHQKERVWWNFWR